MFIITNSAMILIRDTMHRDYFLNIRDHLVHLMVVQDAHVHHVRSLEKHGITNFKIQRMM